MQYHIFNEDFYNMGNEYIELRLIDTYEGTDNELPFYWWNIVLKSQNVTVGKISFRIGHNYHFTMGISDMRLMQNIEAIIMRYLLVRW